MLEIGAHRLDRARIKPFQRRITAQVRETQNGNDLSDRGLVAWVLRRSRGNAATRRNEQAHHGSTQTVRRSGGEWQADLQGTMPSWMSVVCQTWLAKGKAEPPS